MVFRGPPKNFQAGPKISNYSTVCEALTWSTGYHIFLFIHSLVDYLECLYKSYDQDQNSLLFLFVFVRPLHGYLRKCFFVRRNLKELCDSFDFCSILYFLQLQYLFEADLFDCWILSFFPRIICIKWVIVLVLICVSTLCWSLFFEEPLFLTIAVQSVRVFVCKAASRMTLVLLSLF